MAEKELTERQSKVLKFIERSMTLSGYPPTLREIGNEFGIKSTNGVNDHLRALMRKGYLAREAGKSRTLKLLRPKNKFSEKKPKSIPVFKSLTEMRDREAPPLLFAISSNETQEISVFKCDTKGEEVILAKFYFEL